MPPFVPQEARWKCWARSIWWGPRTTFHQSDERSARGGRCLPHLRERLLREVGACSQPPTAKSLRRDSRLPHGCSRRPCGVCGAVRYVRASGQRAQLLQGQTLPEVSGRGAREMDERKGIGTVTGSVFPCRVHAAARDW